MPAGATSRLVQCQRAAQQASVMLSQQRRVARTGKLAARCSCAALLGGTERDEPGIKGRERRGADSRV